MNLSWRKSINIITHGNSAVDSVLTLPTAPPQDIYNLRENAGFGGEILEDIKDCMSWKYKYDERCSWNQNSYDLFDDFHL